MSDQYVESHFYENNNYTKLNDNMNTHNKLLLDTIIGIFGGIILLNLLIAIYHFRESIKSLCNRPIRKQGKMVLLGEMSHNISDDIIDELDKNKV
jgi:hypothetical protein